MVYLFFSYGICSLYLWYVYFILMVDLFIPVVDLFYTYGRFILYLW